nr:metallophosphoesterase [uncultured Cohaesibacter sp.]
MIKNPDMLKFIHLTDCQVASYGGALEGHGASARLRAAIDSINCDHHDADFVVITGDLTLHGDDASYEAFARELRRLSVPSHLLIGNRDDVRTFRFHFPEAQRCDCGYIQGSKRTPFGLCLFLDTSHPGSIGGRYCEARRRWLEGVLRETDGPVMLFMHHLPFAIDASGAKDRQASDEDAFWQLLEPYRQRIRHVFVGDALPVAADSWRGLAVTSMRGYAHGALGIHGVHGAPDGAARAMDQQGLRHHPAASTYGVVMVSADQTMVHMQSFMAHEVRFAV